MTDREDTIQVLYGSQASWTTKNLVLKKGEHGFEWDTNRFKIGDDVTPYSGLDYFVPESLVRELIAAAIADLPANQSGGISSATFTAHVNSATPHSAYDDMPSLVSRYRNRKV